MEIKRTLADFNAGAFWAGITTFTFMVFGALTLQISIVERFHLPGALGQSWILVTWLTPGAVSLFLTLRFKQPLGLGWTIPGLVYLGSLAGRFSFEEVLGANLLAGLLIALLGLIGAGERVIRLVPMPILMSMFAASIIDFVTRMIDATPMNLSLSLPMIAAYVISRRLNLRQLPPVGVSVITGATLILLLGEWRAGDFHLAAPHLSRPGIAFGLEAVLTITIPMVVLVVGLGNAQGLGFLVAQGYRVPANVVTTAVGIMTITNAVFGGHPAAMTRASSAMLGGPSAGPLEQRYWAAVVAFALVFGAALASGVLVALVVALPPEFIVVIAGLAILPSFEDALQRAFNGQLRLGAVIAFAVTLSGSITIAGIPSAFWALIAGVCVSLLVETKELREHWGLDAEPSTHSAKTPPADERLFERASAN